MSQLRCYHCKALKQETEILMRRINTHGKIHSRNICITCLTSKLPNPLAKKVKLLYVAIGCLTLLCIYLLAYKVF